MWSVVSTALTANLFDRLHTRMTADDVARLNNWETKATYYFLDALVSLSLLTKNTEGFQIAQDYAPFLCTNDSRSLVPTLKHMGQLRVKSDAHVLSLLEKKESSATSIKNNQNERKENFNSPDFWARATRNLRAFHASMSGDFYTQLLTELPQWSGVKTMLDIGAGSEILGEMLISCSAHLRYHLFDLPDVVAQIRQQAPHLHSHIALHPGDYNHTPLPTGVDLAFASMSLYYCDNLIGLFRQIYSGLNTAGVFVCCHEGLSHQRTQPTYHIVGRLIPTLNGNNTSFVQGELAQTMLAAGFSRVHSRSIETPFGPLDIDIGYK